MTRPLRILQVVRIFHPNIGGMEKHVEWLSRALAARGHEVSVLTLDTSFADGSRYPPRGEVEGVPIAREPFVGSTRYPLAPGVLAHVRGHDVVHVHALDFLADWLTLTRVLHGVPVVLSTHGGFFHTDFARRLKRAWWHTMTRALVHAVDGLVFTSDQDAELFREITRRGVTIRSAVDLAPWQSIENEPIPGRWITTGRVDSHKGISNLLRTLAEVAQRDPRPFRAEILGPVVVDGLESQLQREARELGLGDRVCFRGKVPFEELREAVRTAELGLFPSEYESFGLSIVEAMASGVVSVANRIRAFEFFVTPGRDGFLAEFGSPGEAAAAIIEARDLAERRPAVSAAARESAARFGWDHVVGQVEAVYEGVVGPQRLAVPARSA